MTQPNYSYRAISTNEAERRAVKESFAAVRAVGLQGRSRGRRPRARRRHGVLHARCPRRRRSPAAGTARQLPPRRQPQRALPAAHEGVPAEHRNRNHADVHHRRGSRTLRPADDAVADCGDAARTPLVRPAAGPASTQPRKLDPRAPSFGIVFYDYASPINEPVEKRWIQRHRLEKKDPSAAVSEPVKPIVYYVDNGAPEPIRRRSIDGASWWNQAFEAAGFRNAFQVKVLPADADPMDVRYNMINWVHRSTRGWSYGGGIVDPRTGEFIKGNVTLGSLRVRQDFTLGRGMIPQYLAGTACLADMSPEPDYLAALDPSADGSADVAGAHPAARGTRDRAHARLRAQLCREHLRTRVGDGLSGAVGGDQERQARSVQRLCDGHRRVRQVRREVSPTRSSRPAPTSRRSSRRSSRTPSPTACCTSTIPTRARISSAHPLASLWDNGDDPVATLKHEMEVRRIGLSQFGVGSIPVGTPLSELELKLLPLYLHHRYQAVAAAKSVGGVYFTYAVRTAAGPNPNRVADDRSGGATEGGAAGAARHDQRGHPAHSGADSRADAADGLRLRRRNGGRVREAHRSRSSIRSAPRRLPPTSRFGALLDRAARGARRRTARPRRRHPGLR